MPSDPLASERLTSSHRLYIAIKRALELQRCDDQPLVNIWKRVIAEDEHNPGLHRFLALMEENFIRIERFITDREEFWLDRRATAKEFTALRKIFDLTLMGQQWGHVRRSYITPERLTLLKLLCVATYSYDAEEQIDKEILLELKEKIAGLIDVTQTADLPHHLKKSLLVNLINVRQTIENYTIWQFWCS
jgi:hypothetical protein